MPPKPPLWPDRWSAGLALAERLLDREAKGCTTSLVALPRGGVPLAAALAESLHLPLVTWAVRKIAEPWAPEVAVGAIARGVVLWADEPPGARPRSHTVLRRDLEREQRLELERPRERFGDPPDAALAGRHLIVVDDGIATGLTARAALQSLRLIAPASLNLAVPVADRRLLPGLGRLVERLEVLHAVPELRSVGEWYERFEPLDDAEVLRLLALVLRQGDQTLSAQQVQQPHLHQVVVLAAQKPAVGGHPGGITPGQQPLEQIGPRRYSASSSSSRRVRSPARQACLRVSRCGPTASSSCRVSCSSSSWSPRQPVEQLELLGRCLQPFDGLVISRRPGLELGLLTAGDVMSFRIQLGGGQLEGHSPGLEAVDDLGGQPQTGHAGLQGPPAAGREVGAQRTAFGIHGPLHQLRGQGRRADGVHVELLGQLLSISAGLALGQW